MGNSFGHLNGLNQQLLHGKCNQLSMIACLWISRLTRYTQLHSKLIEHVFHGIQIFCVLEKGLFYFR
jgi:hypothetical protein